MPHTNTKKLVVGTDEVSQRLSQIQRECEEGDEVTQRLEQIRNECKHEQVMPTFDYRASWGLEADEVRKRWPRFMGICPDCKKQLILYASVEHYIAGDW